MIDICFWNATDLAHIFYFDTPFTFYGSSVLDWPKAGQY